MMGTNANEKCGGWGKMVPAALIAVAIVILGICLKCGIDNIAFRDREVTVKGLAERDYLKD